MLSQAVLALSTKGQYSLRSFAVLSPKIDLSKSPIMSVFNLAKLKINEFYGF
jgi:hypothetical protein